MEWIIINIVLVIWTIFLIIGSIFLSIVLVYFWWKIFYKSTLYFITWWELLEWWNNFTERERQMILALEGSVLRWEKENLDKYFPTYTSNWLKFDWMEYIVKN